MATLTTQNNTNSNVPPIPNEIADKLAAVLGAGQKIFELTYKAHQQIRHEVFVASNTREAIEIGQAYCKAHGTRFIFVNPWLKDLKAATSMKLKPQESEG